MKVEKGEIVKVRLGYLNGKPLAEVEAHGDSWEYEGKYLFSFLFGGDMMMIATWNGTEWVSNH